MGPLYISEMVDVTNFKYGVQLRGSENARLMMSSLREQNAVSENARRKMQDLHILWRKY